MPRKPRLITTMDPVHHKLIEFVLDGRTVAECSELVALSKPQVRDVLLSECFQREYESRRRGLEMLEDTRRLAMSEKIRSAVGELAVEAAEVVRKSLKSRNESLRTRTALEILRLHAEQQKIAKGQAVPGILINVEMAERAVQMARRRAVEIRELPNEEQRSTT